MARHLENWGNTPRNSAQARVEVQLKYEDTIVLHIREFILGADTDSVDCLLSTATMAASTYPPPPPYYKLYKDYGSNSESAPNPPPPVSGTYAMFGSNYTVS